MTLNANAGQVTEETDQSGNILFFGLTFLQIQHVYVLICDERFSFDENKAYYCLVYFLCFWFGLKGRHFTYKRKYARASLHIVSTATINRKCIWFASFYMYLFRIVILFSMIKDPDKKKKNLYSKKTQIEMFSQNKLGSHTQKNLFYGKFQWIMEKQLLNPHFCISLQIICNKFYNFFFFIIR